MATTVLLTAKLFISHLIFINWICAVFACFIMWRQMAVVWQLSLNHLSNVLECRISEWGASLCGHLQTTGALVSWQTTRYWHRPRQTLQSGSRCPHLFKYQSSVIISTIQRSGCISVWGLCLLYIETFDNRKLTMWILYSFSRHILVRGHTVASVRAWGGGVQSSGPEEEYLLLPQPSPAQPTQHSPAQPAQPRSLETVQSHTKTRHKTADILQILPSCWTRSCRGERRGVSSHFSLDTSSARRPYSSVPVHRPTWHRCLHTQKVVIFYRQNGIYFKVVFRSDVEWNKWFSNMQISTSTKCF